MKIRILSARYTEREINTKSGSMKLREQEAVLDQGEFNRQPFKLRLARDQGAYSPGEYTLAPGAFTVGKFGDLELGRDVQLVPFGMNAGTGEVSGLAGTGGLSAGTQRAARVAG